MNSREFKSAQKASSSAFFLSGSAAMMLSSRAISFAVGLRLKQRIYNSPTMSAGDFFSAHRDASPDDPPTVRIRKVTLVIFLNGQTAEAQPDSFSGGSLVFYDLLDEISQFTGSEGNLDKLCIELVGVASSGVRPPGRQLLLHPPERRHQRLHPPDRQISGRNHLLFHPDAGSQRNQTANT